MQPSLIKNLVIIAVVSTACFLACSQAFAEDGYRLWLRYDPLPQSTASRYSRLVKSVVVQGNSPTFGAIRSELEQGLRGLLNKNIQAVSGAAGDNTIVVGTPVSSSIIRSFQWGKELANTGAEGFIIRSVRSKTKNVIVIASQGEVGALYGTFHFLRLLQTGQQIDKLNVVQKPSIKLRMLNHWDNLDGTVERGYAGNSIWKWKELPSNIDPRLRDYARTNASIGINGATQTLRF
jgi:alpha-glucuronidase